MTTLLIAISGSGGGSQGPQGIYPLFDKHCDGNVLKIFPVDTLPDLVQENVEQITKLALEQFGKYENIFVLGHSMGGAIASRVAYDLNKIDEGKVKGLVLMGTQTEGLQILKEHRIPVLFYHGKEDQYFPVWQIETQYKRYAGQKRMVILEGVDHDFGLIGQSKSKEYANDLAKDVLAEIADFFFNLNDRASAGEIITRNVILTPKKGFFKCISAFFSKEVKNNSKT